MHRALMGGKETALAELVQHNAAPLEENIGQEAINFRLPMVLNRVAVVGPDL